MRMHACHLCLQWDIPPAAGLPHEQVSAFLLLYFASGSLDRTIRLWDLTYGMPLSISRPHGGTVRAVALDNTLVASGRGSCKLRAARISVYRAGPRLQ